MKERLAAFIDQLTLYDYLLFGGSVLLFVLLLILAILLRRRTALAFLCTLLAIATILMVPTLGYVKLNDYIYKHDLNVTEIRALEFTDALVIRGSLTNRSKRDFNYCTLTAGAYKVAHNPVLDLLYPLNPFRSGSVTKTKIAKGEQVDFKIFIEPFSYTKDYNVSIGAICR
jgi:hypothetical protein